MSKLIDLFASTKLIGYETCHLLLRVVFYGTYIKAFHSEFEVIDFYLVKTDARWIKTYPKLSIFYIIDKALTSSASRLKLDRLLKRIVVFCIMVFVTYVEFFIFKTCSETDLKNCV